MAITKEVSIVLTQEEIQSPEEIIMKFHVHAEDDMNNEEGVTYTITYPKTSQSEG